MGAPLNIGDRVKLSGGYEQHPAWRQAGEITGVIAGFLRGDRKLHMLVELETPLSVGILTGAWVEARLRYSDGQWRGGEVAHLILHDAKPEAATGQSGDGTWIESHATVLAV